MATVHTLHRRCGINGEKKIQGNGRTAADAAAATKARAEAVTWREIAERSAADYSARDGQSKRLDAMESQGALARGCFEAKDAAKAWEAAADKWEAGERDLAKHFEEEANAAMLEAMDALDKSDDLWEMEQERKSASEASKTPV